MAKQKQRSSAHEGHRDDAERAGAEVGQSNHISALTSCETLTCVGILAKDVFKDVGRVSQHYINGGQLMEEHGDDIDPASTYIPLIGNVSFLQSRLLRLASLLATCLLSFEKLVLLFRKLIATLSVIRRVDCLDSVFMVTDLNVVLRAIVPEQEGKAENDYGEEQAREGENDSPRLVVFQSLCVVILGQDKCAEHGQQSCYVLRSSKDTDTSALPAFWHKFNDHANYYRSDGSRRKAK